jgi:branched-chain amino acid transport system substrate-binding protein
MEVQRFVRATKWRRSSARAGLLALAVLAVMAPVAWGQNHIVVGASISQTGQLAVTGQYVLQAYQLWVGRRERPRRSAPPSGEPEVYDDKSDQATAVRFYERLVTVDKCDILIGPKSSPITFPVTAIV